MLACLGSESPMADGQVERVTRFVGDYVVTHGSRHTYRNKQALRAFLEQKYKDWTTAGASGASQYAAAQGVTPDVIQWWDNNHRSLPTARLQYSEAAEAIIWKFAGPEQEIASRAFGRIFDSSCAARGISLSDLVATGSGRCQNQDRAKEPDEGYKPFITRPAKTDRPTIVVEIGYSESLTQLRCDAHHWLTKTNAEVRVVVLVLINQATRTVRLERWEMSARGLPCGQNPHRPVTIQGISISVPSSGWPTATGAPLIIPLNKLFDQLPAHIPAGDLTITRAQLENFAFTCFHAAL